MGVTGACPMSRAAAAATIGGSVDGPGASAIDSDGVLLHASAAILGQLGSSICCIAHEAANALPALSVLLRAQPVVAALL